MADEKNLYFCSKCNGPKVAYTQYFMKTPPTIFCIKLKRFGSSCEKIVKPISFPQKLNLSHYFKDFLKSSQYNLHSRINR